MATNHAEVHALVTKRQTFLEAKRSRTDNEWERITKNIYPAREDILQTKEPGEQYGLSIYNSTPEYAHDIMASGLHGNMVSPATPWSKSIIRDSRFSDNVRVRRFLDEIDEQVFGALANSNFYLAMQTIFKDGTGLGNSTLYIEENIFEDRLEFTALHPGTVFYGIDRYGNVNLIHRKIRLTLSQIMQMFPDLDERTKKEAEDEPFKEKEVIHAVYPREQIDHTKIDSGNMPFASVWVIIDGTGFNEKNIRVSGFEKLPYFPWRYLVTDQYDAYGRGPGHAAISDSMTVHEAQRLMLGAIERAVEGAVMIPEEMRDTVNMMPRGLNFYGDKDRLIHPVPMGANLPAGEEMIDRLERSVQRHFHTDFFLMLQAAERQMTATEVLEKQSEKATILGPVVGRLTVFLESTLERVMEIEGEAGRMPEPPQELLDAGVDQINIDFLGLLPQIQRRLMAQSGANRSMQDIATVAQFDPTVIDEYDFRALSRRMSFENGMPGVGIRPKADVARIRKQKAAKAQKAEQLAMAESVGKTTKDFAQADQAGGGAMGEAAEELFGGAGA